MREIEFRGKQLNNGEWVCGFYNNETSIESHSSNRKTTRHHIYTQNFDVFVVPETLGQYTGRTDKNGTKIFEGDIVKDVVEPCPKGIIKFGYYETPYKEWGKLSDNPFMKNLGFFIDWCVINFRKDLGFWSNRVEVIGNIYDNPELLEEVC